MATRWEVRSIDEANVLFGVMYIDVPRDRDWLRVAIFPERESFRLIQDEAPPENETMEHVDLQVKWREKGYYPCLVCTSKDAQKLRRLKYFRAA